MAGVSQELRDKFMVNGSDGIAEAEKVITDAGGYVNRGFISLTEELISVLDADKGTGPVNDAIEFLLYEWDYATDAQG